MPPPGLVAANFETAEIKQAITPENIQNLPLLLSGNIRSAAQFVILMPGVTTGACMPAVAWTLRSCGRTSAPAFQEPLGGPCATGQPVRGRRLAIPERETGSRQPVGGPAQRGGSSGRVPTRSVTQGLLSRSSIRE